MRLALCTGRLDGVISTKRPLSITTQSHNASLVIDIELVDHPETIKMELICQKKCTKRTQKITSLYIKNRSFLTLIFSSAVWWSSDAYLIQTWFPYWSILVLSRVHLVQPQNAFLDKDVPVLYICPQMTPLYRVLWSSEIYILKKIIMLFCKFANGWFIVG